MQENRDIRLSEPIFTPRRVIPPNKRKLPKKRMTTAKKQRIEPSYTPTLATEEEKARYVAFWSDKKDKHNQQLEDYTKCNIRFKNVRRRTCGATWYVNNGYVRTCIDCKEELANTYFDYHDKKKPRAPRKSYCYKCRQKRNQKAYDANKAKIKEKSRIYYEKNKEKRKQQFRENYQRRAYGHITKSDESE